MRNPLYSLGDDTPYYNLSLSLIAFTLSTGTLLLVFCDQRQFDRSEIRFNWRSGCQRKHEFRSWPHRETHNPATFHWSFNSLWLFVFRGHFYGRKEKLPPQQRQQQGCQTGHEGSDSGTPWKPIDETGQFSEGKEMPGKEMPWTLK